MKIGEGSAASAKPITGEQQVRVFKGAMRQQEAVIGKLLQGIEQVPTPSGKGQMIDIVA